MTNYMYPTAPHQEQVYDPYAAYRPMVYPAARQQVLPSDHDITEPLGRSAEIQGLVNAAIQAMEAGTRMREHALATYDNAIGRMMAYENTERLPEHQALVESFKAREIQALQNDMAAFEQLTIVNIARVINRRIGPQD